MTPPTHQHRVLVVDDDEDIRETIAMILESEGHTCVGARDGAAALEVLRHDPSFCLVLLDLMMPHMSGWQLCNELAADARFTDLPVVVLTGDTRSDSLQALGAEAGGVGAKPGGGGRASPGGAAVRAFLRKPIELDELLHLVEEHGR